MNSDKNTLKSYLSPEQRETFDAGGYFYVVDRKGYVYLLHDGRSVVQMYDGEQDMHYCVYGVDRYHDRSVGRCTSLLTQLLFLRSRMAYHLIEIACSEGMYYNDSRYEAPCGCPSMMRGLADDEVPRGV